MKKGTQYTLDDYIITKEGEIINKHNNHISKPQKNGKGYLRVNIGHTLYFVHRLVAQKYVPNPNNLPQVNHIDGNKLNNSAENLEWVTNKQNRKHAVDNNLHLSGENCPWAKLKEEEVISILEDKTSSNQELAKKFNISPSTINDIKKGRIWKKVEKIC